MHDSHHDPEVHKKKKNEATAPNHQHQQQQQHYLLCQLLLQDTVIGHNAFLQEMAHTVCHPLPGLGLGLHSEAMLLQMSSSVITHTPTHSTTMDLDEKPFHQVKFSHWLFVRGSVASSS